jgi:hypothetical protein
MMIAERTKNRRQREIRAKASMARRRLFVEQLEERNLLSFLPPVNYPVGSYPMGITAADLTGSGTLDLVVADYALFGGTTGISILRGNGDGTFQDAQTIPSGGEGPQGPWDVKAVDFISHGIPDLVVSNYRGDNLSLLLGNGDGTFAEPRPFAFVLDPTDFQVIGSSGTPDFAVINANRGRIEVIRAGNSTFYNTGTLPTAIATGDFRGIGILDLVVSNRQSNTVSVLLGNDDGTFQQARNYGTGAHPLEVIVGDFTGNGILDLATANYDSNNVTIFLGNGDGQFHFAGTFPVGPNPSSLAAGDFARNGILDLAVSSSSSGTVTVLMGNGDGTFQPPLFFPADASANHVAVADLNGDNFPDIVVTNQLSNDVSVLLNDGNWQNLPWVALNRGTGEPEAHPYVPVLPGPHAALAQAWSAVPGQALDDIRERIVDNFPMSAYPQKQGKFSTPDLLADNVDFLGITDGIRR